MWQVEGTDEFAGWFEDLGEREQEYLVAAVDKLEERGPDLGRPFVDTIEGFRYPNMKELRPPGAEELRE